MRQLSTSQLFMGVALGIFISWGCSTAGEMQDAGAQVDTEDTVTQEHTSIDCSSTSVDGTSLVLLENVADADAIISVALSFRTDANTLFQVGTLASPYVENGRILTIPAVPAEDFCDGLNDERFDNIETIEVLISRSM